MNVIDMHPKICIANRHDWRAWLEDHHDSESFVWLVLFKKSSGTQGISYREALEEALCFGWIDGLKKGIDRDRYAFRFSPRKRNSKWSPANIELAEGLIATGKMTPAGLHAFEIRQTYDEAFLEKRAATHIELPDELAKVLQSNAKAWKIFGALSPGDRKQYIAWMTSANMPKTARRRAQKAIQLLLEKRRPGM